MLTGCGSVSVAQLPCHWDGGPRNTQPHRAAVRMQERGPAALTMGAGPTASAYQMPARPAEAWPHACTRGPAATAGCRSASPPYLVLTIRLFFSICPKEASAVGARKQEEEKGASCLLSPVGRDWSWPGKHRWRIPESTGAWWWETFSLSHGLKLLLYRGQSAQSVAGRVCTGRPFCAAPSLQHC